MTARILTAIAILIAIACGSTAQVLPPAEFDRPYKGTLIVTRVKTPAEIKAACPNAVYNSTPLGCAKVSIDLNFCHVFLLPPEKIAQFGIKPEDAYRHEIGHCNGWEHK